MFDSLETTNFRKLTAGRFEFVEGLNAIRGLNEQGKSTLLEAMGYAMFGVDALRESLEDVVTWGEKPASLKVRLVLTVNKDQYEISRSKAGAEIKLAGKVLVTGQTPVTLFVEGLLGAAPGVASKLMIASQASIRGALSEGPTATARLIEQLSNFGLIDEIVQLVQEKLPCGNTTALEQELRTLTEQVQATSPGELSLSEKQAELAQAEAEIARERAELAAASAELGPAVKAAEAARTRLQAFNAARAEAEAARKTLGQAGDSISALQPVSSVSAAQLADLRAKAEAQKGLAAARRAAARLASLSYPEVAWEGSRASFDAEVKKNAGLLADTLVKANQCTLAIATATGQLIKETSCAFCGKDLTDVPEVTLRNSTLGQEILGQQSLKQGLEDRLRVYREDEAAYKKIETESRRIEQVYQECAGYIQVMDTAVPRLHMWTGPDIRNSETQDYAKAVAEAEAEIARAHRDHGQALALVAQKVTAEAHLKAAEEKLKELEPLVKADRSVGLETDLRTKVQYHQTNLARLQGHRDVATNAIESTRQLYEAKIQRHNDAKEAVHRSEEKLKEAELNNVLLKKLRGARPRVADALWSAVLPTISHYFAHTRGVKSLVTRDEKGFRIDGKPVPGFSGSTLDSLGLAVRIALVKTFLPNNDFLVLDEPAAACDDERETNMLGTVTTAGFKQVLLVTHSPLADAFASQVVAL